MVDQWSQKVRDICCLRGRPQANDSVLNVQCLTFIVAQGLKGVVQYRHIS